MEVISDNQDTVGGTPYASGGSGKIGNCIEKCKLLFDLAIPDGALKSGDTYYLELEHTTNKVLISNTLPKYPIVDNYTVVSNKYDSTTRKVTVQTECVPAGTYSVYRTGAYTESGYEKIWFSMTVDGNGIGTFTTDGVENTKLKNRSKSTERNKVFKKVWRTSRCFCS